MDGPLRDGPRELSAGQEFMWLAHRMEPGSAAYNVTLAVRVRSPLHLPALRAAVAALVTRHDLLRSVFHEIDGVPARTVRGPGTVTLDVREAPGAGEAELTALAREIGDAPYRLDTGGAFRVALLRRGPADAVLVVGTHHIVSDRTSQWLVLRDLLDAYRGIAAGGPPAWADLDVTYDDHVARERRLLASPRRAVLERRWAEICAGAPAAELPADRPRPARRIHRGATVVRRIPDEVRGGVDALAGDLGITPFACLLAAFQAVLHRYTGRDVFLVGCPASTRFGRGGRDLVGYFVNSLALRAEFGPGTTFRDAAASAQRQVTRAMAAAPLPFPLAVRALPVPRAAGRPPLFQIAVTLVAPHRREPLLALLDGDLDHHGLRLSLLDVPHMEGQLDLSVELRYGRASQAVAFRYDTALYDEPTIERLADHFVRLAGICAAEPDRRIAAVPLLDAAAPAATS